MFLEEVERLGKRVDTLWQEKGRNKTEFSKIAFETLKTHSPYLHFHLESFLDELWKKNLPEQFNLGGNFGQPPVTLYRNEDFLIDVYFWVTPDISIHSHSFQGAFTVLHGLSLQSQYVFKEKENFKDQMLIGDLCLQETKLLRPGEVEEILDGPPFIHQVWHLSFPTVSLAVRTLSSEGIQYVYSKPHFAFVCNPLLPGPLQRKLESLLMLRSLHQPEEPHLLQLLSLLEPGEALSLLQVYFSLTGDLSMIERTLARLSQLEKWVPPFLDSLRCSYEKRFDIIEISDEGERFFLALLHISTSREQSEKLFRAVFPDEDFEASVLKWLKSLLKKKSFHIALNETAQDVFTYLFQGDDEKEICRRLSEIYEVENNEDFQSQIHHFCNQLRSNHLLKPFLPEPSSSLRPMDLKELPTVPQGPLIPMVGGRQSFHGQPDSYLEKESVRHFNERGYWILKNVLSPPTLDIISNYFSIQESSGLGFFKEDTQAKHSKGVYADPLCESLLVYLQPLFEEGVGKELTPTYSYARIYGPTSILERHRDRDSCEISATLTIGYQARALWPLFLETNGEVIPIKLDKGDSVLYKGCELFHWRERFEGQYWIQVFLHFVDKHGRFSEWRYDRRKTVGDRSMFERAQNAY